MHLESARGIKVDLPDDEHAKFFVRYGDRAREEILNCAGRIHKHRRQLELIMAQQLDDEQRRQVKRLAKILARAELVDKELEEQGYGAYLTRRDRGGLMPDSWPRIVAQAERAVADIEVDGEHLENVAMLELGFFTDEDREWSQGIVEGCTWSISVPEGWGGRDFQAVPLGH